MTREDIKAMLPVLQAFAEGKEIEIRVKDKWYRVLEICNETNPQNYRIKPEPKYRPFKDAEECWKEMLKHQPFGWVRDKSWGIYDMIVRVTDSGILFNGSALKDITAYDCPFEKTSFADGTPFGIKMEE